MSFRFYDLDQKTRSIMADEVNLDIENNQLYLSKRFNQNGINKYPELIIDSVNEGNETTLANALRATNSFKDREERRTQKGVSLVKVPQTAPETFAEGEFNRFYIRALCIRATEEDKSLEIYRARESGSPRSQSLRMVGQQANPKDLLADLRNNVGVDTALGLPPGPNSGLSVKLA